MSIDKSTMKIFFEAMEGTMLGSGYSSKIINTPFGPFKWNDTIELWENVNNGIQMNNISFQDMMIMGYETTSGDKNSSTEIPALFTGDLGNLTVGSASGSTDYWAKVGGPVTGMTNSSFITFNRATTIQIDSSNDNAAPSAILYSKNDGTKVTNTGALISVTAGDTIRIGLTTPPTPEVDPEVGSGTISIYSPSLPTSLITTVSYSFTVSTLG
jgi:hypothetical protein